MKEIIIGGQNIKEIIQNNQLYIDKTKALLKLVTSGNKYYFLSRPRRFGKSLAIDTMKEMFLGNKELFKELYAYDNYKEWDKSYPVILISMAGFNYDFKPLSEYLKAKTSIFIGDKKILGRNYINWEFNDLSELIHKVYEETGKQVVVLVDEYDTPFTHTLDNKDNYEKVRKFFQGFYSNIKDTGDEIRFFYLSGLTKVAQASLFSTLNNLNDISFSRDNYDVIGYTVEEIKLYFKDYIENSLKELGLTEDELLRKLKDYYDGYNFGRLDDKLYNPWSINNFFIEKRFEDYWVETGGDSLSRTIIAPFPERFSEIFNKLDIEGSILLEKNTLSFEDFNEFNIPLLLLNSGYLTFENDTKNLKVVNKEARHALDAQYVYYLKNTNKIAKEYIDICNTLTKAILEGKKENIQKNLLLLSDIKASPYDWMDKNPEGFMKDSLFLALRLMGLNPKGELQGTKGRTDIIFEKAGLTYIIEYKIDGALEEGMKQINDKYLNQFIHKKGYKIVINYKKKTTKDFEVLLENF